MTAHAHTLPPVRSRPSAGVPRQLVPTRLVAAMLAVAVSLLLMTSVQADQPVQTVEYAVASGDTLWSIAQDLTGAGEDVRVAVSTIRDLNDLTDSTIHPGQVLRLPAA